MKKIKISYVIILLLASFLVWIVIAYNKRKNIIQEFNRDLFYMDTYINVKIYTTDSVKANKTLTLVDNIYKEYHQLTDRYNAYTNVNNVYFINNNSIKDEKIKIDSKLYELIKQGIIANSKTDGLININMGDVIDVWKKYRDAKTGVPTLIELKNTNIDIDQIKLLDNNNILNNHPNIDLGAIAKGYVTQIVANYIKEQGFDKFLINAGGNVIVGNHYNKEVFRIGIEEPNSNGGIYQIIKGNNMVVTTSGSYERFYEYNGITYHHIIDPKSLFPTNYMKSVTVITKDGLLGDTLSTALFLMPIMEGKKFLKNFAGVEAIWYTLDNQVIKTDGFNKYE
ncbi:MAG: FAD:protein FMN transferase [Bacilli bacterium]